VQVSGPSFWALLLLLLPLVSALFLTFFRAFRIIAGMPRKKRAQHCYKSETLNISESRLRLGAYFTTSGTCALTPGYIARLVLSALGQQKELLGETANEHKQVHGSCRAFYSCQFFSCSSVGSEKKGWFRHVGCRLVGWASGNKNWSSGFRAV
jgi:hypothetical protein